MIKNVFTDNNIFFTGKERPFRARLREEVIMVFDLAVTGQPDALKIVQRFIKGHIGRMPVIRSYVDTDRKTDAWCHIPTGYDIPDIIRYYRPGCLNLENNIPLIQNMFTTEAQLLYNNRCLSEDHLIVAMLSLLFSMKLVPKRLLPGQAYKSFTWRMFEEMLHNAEMYVSRHGNTDGILFEPLDPIERPDPSYKVRIPVESVTPEMLAGIVRPEDDIETNMERFSVKTGYSGRTLYNILKRLSGRTGTKKATGSKKYDAIWERITLNEWSTLTLDRLTSLAFDRAPRFCTGLEYDKLYQAIKKQRQKLVKSGVIQSVGGRTSKKGPDESVLVEAINMDIEYKDKEERDLEAARAALPGQKAFEPAETGHVQALPPDFRPFDDFLTEMNSRQDPVLPCDK